MAEVVLDALTRRFGETLAVNDLNLVVKDCEFLALVGPSGCGKSTTLRMIGGLEPITSGEIRFDGKDVSNLATEKRDIAMVFQSYALYPHMSVRANLEFPLKNMNLPKTEIAARVQGAAHRLSITDYLDRRPRQLSGGQRQRVALGRAIIRETGVFLLDEPLSNLDAQLRVSMRAELKRLHAQLERTFIFVTHDQAEAMTMADRIAVMSAGVLQQVGSPDEIYLRPANRFVAEFMGNPAINLLPATITTPDITHMNTQTPTHTPTVLITGANQPISFPVAPTALSPVTLGSRELHVGIRSEDLRLVPTGTGTLSGTIALVESLYPEVFVTIDLTPNTNTHTGTGTGASGASSVVLRTTADHHCEVGERVDLSFDPGTAHLFGADGTRIPTLNETTN
jgi:ABC-type sugar transport system ATPase subunit